MFLAGSLGVIVGGPISILISIISPETVGGNGPDSIWRGMSTIG